MISKVRVLNNGNELHDTDTQLVLANRQVQGFLNLPACRYRPAFKILMPAKKIVATFFKNVATMDFG